ncbi:MAG: neutral/alkaline non-lysosomal ceramidase N-terminal domain-containing protein [Myxococcota bacterium]
MVPTIWALLACHGPDDPGPAGTQTTEAPQPGPLQVGVARVRMPVPVGIGTVGYNGLGVPAGETPFSEIFPGTVRVHDHPDFRAIAISRGPGFEVVLLRTDMVGVFQHLRRAVVLELEQRLGRNLDDALIVGATHTHSGPGRVIDMGGPFDIIADRFFPEHYERIVGAMADTVEQALADLAPGRLGIAQGYTDEGHDDRRCEDGQDHENGALPLVAVEREGELVGLAMAYAVHGTILGIDDLTLSEDTFGGIEQAVEDRLGKPVVVAGFNAWGADMSPSSPAVPMQPGAAQPDGYDRMEEVGVAVADAVEAALPSLQWTDEPEILSRTFRVPLGRDVIGYDSGVFPYDYGAVYCTADVEDCDPATVVDDLDKRCLPFPEDYAAPPQTVFTAGHLGDLRFVTFPGEPGTLLAEQVLADIGEEPMLFLGYAQDYTGYSILEDDWWQGGYEASGALWGPRQGAYLADRAVAAFGWAHGGAPEAQPDPVLPFEVGDYAPYVPTPGLDVGTVVTEVAADVGPQDEVVFVVQGEDPWLGTPLATLVDAGGAPVLRRSGTPVTSDGQAFWTELVPVPSYDEAPDAPARAFQWALHLPVDHAVVGAVPALAGTYRLSVALPRADGTTTTVESAPFTVTR